MKPMCQFCLSNGESLEHCSSHQLKSSNGLVSCPILRAFICPLCGATGDHAHTLSHCHSRNSEVLNAKGACLKEMKKKKNAAGREAKTRWPKSTSSLKDSPVAPNHLLSSESLLPAAPVRTPLVASNFWDWGWDCYQLSLYRHSQCVQHYREKCLYHLFEITRLRKLKLDQVLNNIKKGSMDFDE